MKDLISSPFLYESHCWSELHTHLLVSVVADDTDGGAYY